MIRIDPKIANWNFSGAPCDEAIGKKSGKIIELVGCGFGPTGYRTQYETLHLAVCAASVISRQIGRSLHITFNKRLMGVKTSKADDLPEMIWFDSDGLISAFSVGSVEFIVPKDNDSAIRENEQRPHIIGFGSGFGIPCILFLDTGEMHYEEVLDVKHPNFTTTV